MDPASRPVEFRARAFEAAARLTVALESSRDHRESAQVMMRYAGEALGIERQVIYLDEKGSGEMNLICSGGIVGGSLPRMIGAGSAFAVWLLRGQEPGIIESFFGSAGELAGSELKMRDAFAEAEIDSARALRFGGETIGLYLFASGGRQSKR